MQCYPFIHSDDQTAAPADDLKIYCAADCPAQPVEWLWPGKIPIGKVTLLVGDPGTGKSLVALDIASRLSRAAEWPDEEGSNSFEPSGSRPSTLDPRLPSSTLIFSAEDDLADTIRPRLDSAGADPRRVFVIPSIADLRHDFAQLRAAVNRAPNCRLIIIDPVNAYVGPSDSHFQTIVRKVLAPLAELATEKRIAVLAIAHLRKNDGPAIHRAAGSMGFVAAARAVWTVCRDESNPGRRMLLPLKNNLSSAARGLAYTIQSNDAHHAPIVAWDSTPIAASAEQAFAPAAKKRGPEAVELQDAGEWLRRALAHGPQPASQLTEQAAQFGFLDRTLRRALHAIGGSVQKRGILEGWWWELPATREGEAPAEPTPEKLDPFEKTCPLPEFFNAPPPQSAPPPQHTTKSIATPQHRNRRTGRFSDQFSQAPIDRRRDSNRTAKKLPTSTGNPILDGLLDALRQPLPNQTAELAPSSPNTS